MADNLIKWIAPVRARRQELEAHPDRVLEMIDEGSTRARKTAQATMETSARSGVWVEGEAGERGNGESSAALKNSGAGN